MTLTSAASGSHEWSGVGPAYSDRARLIEHAFPIRETSLDSVHEKSIRHGHISTLHIWPARRPLAACRAALVAALLPDPGAPDTRRRVVERLAGRVVKVAQRKKLPGGRVEHVEVDQTEGGVLHWGREASADLAWFREEIRKAYGGRAPKVLDPFAGGGAIPLEAMRLGCEVTAADINPVAWFILKCTLEYPQDLAGQRRPLPEFALRSRHFMERYYRATGKPSAAQLERLLDAPRLAEIPPPEVDLSWHVRAWGWWVLQRARSALDASYPKVGGHPTVAYFWARTVACKNCRATIPLLKTLWLSRKDSKRVRLTVTPNRDRSGVEFGVQRNVPTAGANAAQRREHDRRLGAGTMSRAGATCPCCGVLTMTMEDIRLEGQAGRLRTVMTAVAVDGERGKEYRLPDEHEIQKATDAAKDVPSVFAEIPFGLPDEPLPGKEALGLRLPLYGFDRWYKLFTPRQLLTLGVFVRQTRVARDTLRAAGYPDEWVEAIAGYLALALDRLANQCASVARWHSREEKVEGTFARFALPIIWDFAEVNPLGSTTGGYTSAIDWVALVAAHLREATEHAPPPSVRCRSAVTPGDDAESYDVVVTDPPYYDAIPYSDLMDYFYVWLRRTVAGTGPDVDGVFIGRSSPKWDLELNDGELIDDASRHGGDAIRSRETYEGGMARAFQACQRQLRPGGAMVVVFAHKEPRAWEALAGAIIRSGFVVDGSWPIQTEMGTRQRARSSAALSSSIWLVCRKRPTSARPGWDNRVLDEVREKITARLREFWDAGIRGPDFVWAATGPALEAYSRHPVVRKANQPDSLMSVTEFLVHVRRIVVDFVVGRVLTRDGDSDAAAGLDDVTTYYLLHRNDYQLSDVPIGACILYAVSCGLSDGALVEQYDLLTRSGKADGEREDDEDDRDGDAEGVPGEELDRSGSSVRLKPWKTRTRKSLGQEAVGGRPVPLIDQVHRLMHLWQAGDVGNVDEYLDALGLRRNEVFERLLQALIELAAHGSEERSLLEKISNHVRQRGAPMSPRQVALAATTTRSVAGKERLE